MADAMKPITEHALIAFMDARLDESQQRAELALEAISGRWDCWAVVAQQLVACCDTVPSADRAYQLIAIDGDPAQVLRDVTAKRQIVESYRRMCEGVRHLAQQGEPAGLDTLRAAREALARNVRSLAEVWSEHPGYSEAVQHG
jgi:Family of unknown function (DUF6221)